MAVAEAADGASEVPHEARLRDDMIRAARRGRAARTRRRPPGSAHAMRLISLETLAAHSGRIFAYEMPESRERGGIRAPCVYGSSPSGLGPGAPSPADPCARARPPRRPASVYSEYSVVPSAPPPGPGHPRCRVLHPEGLVRQKPAGFLAVREIHRRGACFGAEERGTTEYTEYTERGIWVVCVLGGCLRFARERRSWGLPRAGSRRRRPVG